MYDSQLKAVGTVCAVLFATSLSATAASASTTFFKCTATSGATQYAQRPISGQKCTLIRVDGTPASAREAQQRLADQRSPVRAAATQSARNTAATPTTAAAPAEPPKPAPASKEQCEQLAQARATLEQGGRVYETDDKGERRHLSEEERVARLTEYQNTAKTRCS